ncbi:MAG: peptide chain release factor N(5)-glutamine methyltransferase [Actinomycetales bacterium]|nr:peptide chain release factor N(5)-glutamine methyltransferase [Actinomycetales bacterium]
MELDREKFKILVARLESAGISSPDHDLRALAEYATTHAQLDSLIEQRCQRVPLQHLTGLAYFRHLSLEVGSGVFIPRPETELLAGAGIEYLRNLSSQILEASEVKSELRKPLVFDLCAGSGAIAISLATEIPNISVHAVEVSVDAAHWLIKNVDRYSEQITRQNSRITIHIIDATATDKFSTWFGKADLVLANPPYIPDEMVPREPEVRDYDPHLALFGGPDGLAVPLAVARTAAKLLSDGGFFGMEHADVQGEGELGLPSSLREIQDSGGAPVWFDVVDHLDYNNLARFTTAIKQPIN